MVLRLEGPGWGEVVSLNSLWGRDHFCEGTSPVLLLSPCLGLLPHSLAFLLFWFNKTKSGSLAERDGERAARPHLITNPKSHHPQAHPGAPAGALTPSHAPYYPPKF